MPKSRNRSRDARKRAQKKRLKREKIARELASISKQSTAMLNAAELSRLGTIVPADGVSHDD